MSAGADGLFETKAQERAVILAVRVLTTHARMWWETGMRLGVRSGSHCWFCHTQRYVSELQYNVDYCENRIK